MIAVKRIPRFRPHLSDTYDWATRPKSAPVERVSNTTVPVYSLEQRTDMIHADHDTCQFLNIRSCCEVEVIGECSLSECSSDNVIRPAEDYAGVIRSRNTEPVVSIETSLVIIQKLGGCSLEAMCQCKSLPKPPILPHNMFHMRRRLADPTCSAALCAANNSAGNETFSAQSPTAKSEVLVSRY